MLRGESRANRGAARALLVLVALAWSQPVVGQASTDIFLADVSVVDGELRIGGPRNVTDRAGYDNQPWFLPDGGSFLYSSERDGQTEIFRYDIASGAKIRLTHTPENEYSPSLTQDGSRMLVVRWPVDMSTGALWWFTPEGEPLAEARGSYPRVGFYAFAGEGLLALFINDDVQSFRLADLETGESRLLGEGMNGSAPRAIPGGGVSFQQRQEDGRWWLMRLNPATSRSEPLVPMVDDVPNYTWTPRGTVLAASGNTIHEWHPGTEEWVVVATFDDPALQSISRLALTAAGDRLALVAARPPTEEPRR
jgi:hypothetical protein